MPEYLDYTKPLPEMVFRPPKKNAQGGFSVFVQFKSPTTGTFENGYIQTPRMALPFGVSVLDVNDGGQMRKKYSLDASFRGKESNPQLQQFWDFVKAFDDRVIEEAVKNSEAWFGKKMSEEVIREFYRGWRKEAKDPKWADTIKSKMQMRYDKLDVELFNETREHIQPDDITTGSDTVQLVMCSSLWFVNKNFGPTFNLVQAKIYAPAQLKGYALRDLPEDIDEKPAKRQRVEDEPAAEAEKPQLREEVF